MSDDEQAALAVMGYNKKSWDNREPWTFYMHWQDLTDEQQTAAKVLGYRAKKWDKSGAKLAYTSKKWFEFTDDEKTALMVLGYTATSWDDTSPLPPSAFKPWEALTECGKCLSVARFPSAVIVLRRRMSYHRYTN